MIFGACQSCEAPTLQCPYLEIAIAKKLVFSKQVRGYHSRICQQTSFLAMAISKYGH
jgi:hypothetical protein